jgi:hypothetical protein
MVRSLFTTTISITAEIQITAFYWEMPLVGTVEQYKAGSDTGFRPGPI